VSDLPSEQSLADATEHIERWLASLADGNPAITAVDRAAPGDLDADGRGGLARWYVRMRGEEKEFTTVWLTLGQRTLRYETYVMPAPAEHRDEVFEQALRRNERMVGAHFSIGVEDALFLRGEIPVSALTDAELDRIVGSLYAYVEASFPELIRLGFASHFS
jgi:hypothetical protein